jgi:phage replication O-like protein O
MCPHTDRGFLFSGGTMSLSRLNFTQVHNEFIDEYMQKISPRATVLFLAISRKTIGWHKESDAISLSQLKEMTGMSKPTVLKGIEELIQAGLINQLKGSQGRNNTSVYDINFEKGKNSLPDEEIKGKDSLPIEEEKGKNSLPINDIKGKDSLPTKESNIKKEDKYMTHAQEAIRYLNIRTGKHYKPTSQNYQYVHARLSEGYTLEDCRKVIDIKCRQWLKDPKMKQFLRPLTLFQPSKFDNYLNEWEPRKIIDLTEEG